MTANITPKSTVADIRAALVAAGIDAPAKASKAALLDLLHPETALDVAPSDAEPKPAPKKAKAKTGALDVRVAPKWTRVYAANGARVARVVTGSPLTDGKANAKNVRFADGSWIVAAHETEVRAALAAGALL